MGSAWIYEKFLAYRWELTGGNDPFPLSPLQQNTRITLYMLFNGSFANFVLHTTACAQYTKEKEMG